MSYQAIEQFLEKNIQGVIIIWGATATGKSSMSIDIAKHFKSLGRQVEIISADSRQIYRYMDIGTDKILLEQRGDIPHHMIDIVAPDQTYTAGQWKQEVEALIGDIHSRGHIPLVVGGTGLYIDMLYKNFSMPEVAPDMSWRDEMMKKENEKPGFLFKQLQKIDPEESMKHHPNSTRYILRALEIYEKTGQKKSDLAKELPVKRPLYMLGLRREKEDTNRRINARIKEMMQGDALIQENKELLDMGYTNEHTAMNGIGYKEVLGYIYGEYDREKCIELLKRNTHRYAKRQRSWFRRYIMDIKARPKENVMYEVIHCN